MEQLIEHEREHYEKYGNVYVEWHMFRMTGYDFHFGIVRG